MLCSVYNWIGDHYYTEENKSTDLDTYCYQLDQLKVTTNKMYEIT